MKSPLKLLIAILICLTIGSASGFLTANAITDYYLHLNKPTWNPPNWIFGPVWTTLYIMMGVSLWLVWKSDLSKTLVQKACLVFALQLFLNFWWSIIFFNMQSPGWAFVEIILLLSAIIYTIFQFSKISKPAAWLLFPYISWVSFASILNFKIFSLN
jgi:tryptophan-rich sensory protein